MPFSDIFRGKRVLVTRHTGFKGSWLCEMLLAPGADFTLLALPMTTTQGLFDELDLFGHLKERRGDIRGLFIGTYSGLTSAMMENEIETFGSFA